MPAPLAVIAGAVSIISTLIGLVSTFIQAAWLATCWITFFVITALIFINLFNIPRLWGQSGFTFLDWLGQHLLRAQNCVPPQNGFGFNPYQ